MGIKNKYDLSCNIAQTLNIIGDRWTLLIIHEIFLGKKTYKELEINLNGIASNLLANRLKELEKAGIILSELYQEHPRRYSYSITEKGKDLREVFNSIILWGHKYLEVCYKEIVDKSTKDPVKLVYYNSKTNQILSSDEIEIREVSK